MWETIYTETFNYFTIVVRHLVGTEIYKLYARRLGTAYCPFFILSHENRQVVPGNWMVGLDEFRKELSEFNPPLRRR